jgi:hypothetical protein
MDAGWGDWVGGVGGEQLQAVADVVAEVGHVDVGESGWVRFEFAEGGGEEAGGAEGIFAVKVVEGDGDLDEALQEGFLGLGGVEPDGFPVFVGGEEVGFVVVAQALGERALGPIECHGNECIEDGKCRNGTSWGSGG